MATYCAKCGEKQGILAALSVDLSSGKYICQKCLDRNVDGERQAREVQRQRVDRLIQISETVVLTTTPAIDGYRVKKYLGIESVEFVIGTGVFSEVSSSIADFFGSRSSSFEQKLRAAKQHALNALKFVAAEKGANAVVAIDLDYTEFTGNRIALIINGTLVLVEPISAGSSYPA